MPYAYAIGICVVAWTSKNVIRNYGIIANFKQPLNTLKMDCLFEQFFFFSSPFSDYENVFLKHLCDEKHLIAVH